MKLFRALLVLLLLAPVRGDSAPGRFQVRGLVRGIAPDKRNVTIAHEEIPGYMGAMTMTFRVAKEEDTGDLHPGDSVSFTLHVTATDAWIDTIHREATATIFPFPTDKAAAAEVQVGGRWPNAKLLDDQGHTIFLHDFRGRPVAFTFIYLGCPLPTYCPLMNHNFEEAAQLLERLHLTEQVRLLSLSMDPANDTPDKLAAVAAGYEAKPPLWTFASVSTDQLRPLADAAGLQFTNLQGQIVHNLRTVILDREGRLRHVFRGNSWTPQELVAELRAATSAGSKISKK